MRTNLQARIAKLLPAAVLMAAVAIALGCANRASAGIIAPQQIGMNAEDLAKWLADKADDGAGSSESTSQARENSKRLPLDGHDLPVDPLGLHESQTPLGSNSSSSSTSSTGGPSSVPVVCVLDDAIATPDASPLGRLAEDHGLSLPVPPGTDLLRPPRALV